MSGSSSENILDARPPKADLRIAYGNDPNQFADLRLPKGKEPYPVLLNIHGGFWRTRYDLGHAGFLCAALTAKGIVTANVEYRRVGNPGGGWPGTFADVRSAYQFLVQSARKYDFDASRMVVMGHSAGGQLALCLAAHETSVKAVVSLAGVVDMQRGYALHLSNDAVAEFLGGTPTDVPDHYREADPMALSVHMRQWLVHGSADDIVPVDFSRDYVKTKQTRKEDAQLVEIAGCSHFDLIDPTSKPWKEVARVVLEAISPKMS